MMVKPLTDLNVKIYADGASLADMLEYYQLPFIKGFTTNPTLMKKAGITDYSFFAKEVLKAIPDRPISFEVLDDDIDQMIRQARKLSGWGENVYVKIPVMNSLGRPTTKVIQTLLKDGVKINITALMSLEQVNSIVDLTLNSHTPIYISVFGGRIADTGRDPETVISKAVMMIKQRENTELLWASPREMFNIYQADRSGCHIITVTQNILAKLPVIGKDLLEYSLETVQMFFNDAKGYTL